MDIGEFLQTSRANTTASILQFPQVDVEGVTKRLRLLERAREQAQLEFPASDSDGPDSTEHDIIYEIESEAKTQFDHYIAHQKTYSDRVSDLGIESLILEGSSVAADATADFDKETHLGTGELFNRKREVIETHRELAEFRKRENLTRPAYSYNKRQQKYGVLLLILVLEAVLNGAFLAKGSAFGLVGGVFEALVIAGTNVVVAALIGFWILRFAGHKNYVLAGVALVLGVGYLASAFGFNLGVAHYREALSGDPFEAAVLARQALLTDPFGITDIRSWLLFVIGMVFSVVALLDGWLMDDPYPGYGRRMRHNLTALNAYNNLKEELLNHLEDIKRGAEAKMDRLGQAAQDRNAEYSNVVLRSLALTAAMDQHFSNLQQAANSLIRHYRDENLRHRKTPAPKRFGSSWTYNRPPTGVQISSEGTKQRLEKTISDLAERIPIWRRQLHTAYRASLDQYRRIDDLVDANAP
jgi:hypothetical protein